MADIIDIAKVREAHAAAEATARLHGALCIAAEVTAVGALCVEDRLQLLSALLSGFAPGLAWQLSLRPAAGASMSNER